jgi:hypothetical protein
MMWGMGCSEYDYYLSDICVEEGDGFDIEEVSTLQDAAGYPSNRDAVVLDFEDSMLGPDDTWRVVRIDLLAMVPDWVFDTYEGGDVLRVDVWDADSPSGAGDWHVSQAIDPTVLDWSDVSLSQDAYWAGQRDELEQRAAWWSFDFRDVIPEEGMTSSRYTVSISWADKGLPTLGYSNFNLNCGRNWTDYGDSRWTLNSADGDGDACSWPMVRVGVETRREVEGGCDAR